MADLPWSARVLCGQFSAPLCHRRCWSANSSVAVPARKRLDAQTPQGRPRMVDPEVLCVVRRRPSLPHGPPCSTIGAERLNFRVRNGTGCFPDALITETLWRIGAKPASIKTTGLSTVSRETSQWTRSIFVGTSPRPISTGQLHTLLCFHIRPINPVV